MTRPKFKNITIETTVNKPVQIVWQYWNEPEHIVKWNYASEDWHTTKASNNLKIGGKFSSRMEAKDGSIGFDFEGIYEEIVENQLISYKLDDDRCVTVTFENNGNSTKIVETFDAESENSLELQRQGWQSILNHFKKYVEQS